MNLTSGETNLVFSIMNDLSGDFDQKEVRRRVGRGLLELLKADYFVSSVWDDESRRFGSCVHINMTDDNLETYENHYRFCDPIIETLRRRKKATLVSEVMQHDKLARTEFYNDFLNRDGLCYGLNFFAYDRGENIGDLRIWRGSKSEDFSKRDAQIVDAIGPSVVNALVRAHGKNAQSSLRFAHIGDEFGFTRRETEVADLLAVGHSDDEICAKLGFSKPTLRSHIGAIFGKSGVNRRSRLAQVLAEKNRSTQ